MATATSTATPMTLDTLLALYSINDHPAVQRARQQLTDTTAALEIAERGHAEAQAELSNVETAAGIGKRDDKRLALAHDTLRVTLSDLRIATAAQEHASRALTETYADTCRTVERAFQQQHRVLVREFAEVLDAAKRANDLLTRLEDRSVMLFRGGAYREHPGKPLTEATWRREFGHPSSTSESRYSYWRTFWKDYLK